MLWLSCFSCTCLSWLALLALVYYFAMPWALFISVPCILPPSSILLTFFCNWETSSFFPGHSVSLAFLAHWSFLTTSPLVLFGLKWNVRTTERFWGNYPECCWAAAFQPSLISSVSSQTQVPLIHIEILQSFLVGPELQLWTKGWMHPAWWILSYYPMFTPQ